MIEPGPFIGRVFGREPVEIVDRAFEPQAPADERVRLTRNAHLDSRD